MALGRMTVIEPVDRSGSPAFVALKAGLARSDDLNPVKNDLINTLTHQARTVMALISKS
jgi:hypothetical protein